MKIQIYTLTKFFRHKKDITIRDNNAYFDENILPSMIDSLGQEVMRRIDGVTKFDPVSGAIVTPFGSTTIDHLSCGCKTVLNYLYSDEKYKLININQCGDNALEVLFDTMEKVPHIQRDLILQHFVHNRENIIKQRNYYVDDIDWVTDDIMLVK